MSEEFNIGDVVIHKTSGTKGVISHVYKKCINPKHKIAITCALHSEDCKNEKTNRYDISLDFNETTEKVKGFLLSPVKENKTSKGNDNNE